MKLVRVVFDIPLDKAFTYRTGRWENVVAAGMRIRAPFGRQKKLGWVLEEATGALEERTYKTILKVYDKENLFTRELLELACYLARRYFCSPGQALAAINKNLALARKEPVPLAPVISEPPATGLLPELLSDLDLEKFHAVILLARPQDRLAVHQTLVTRLLNGSCLTLFPEITGAETFFQQLRGSLGEKVCLFHGALSKSEKRANWEVMLKQKNLVVVGTRLAVFAPLSDLKLVVVEDGLNSSYQEKQIPRYQALELAQWRALRNSIPVVTTQSCLSVEQYLKAKENEVQVRYLAGETPSPEVLVLPVTHQNRDKQIPFLAGDTVSLMEETLLKKQKVALVHCRKGSHRILVCRDCQYRFPCPACQTPLIYRNKKEGLFCRTCAKTWPFPGNCPQCHGKQVVLKGFGLERMRDMLQAQYPEVAIFSKSGQQENKQSLEQAGIILETQAIRKVLDWVPVHLVIIPQADSFMNLPGFQAEERFFVLVREILARLPAGPGGRMVVQTYNPNLTVYQALKQNNPNIFYEKELAQRKQLGYPPFCYLIKIEVREKKPDVLAAKEKLLKSFLAEKNLSLSYAGPPLSRTGKKKPTWLWVVKTPGLENLQGLAELLADIQAEMEINPEII